MFGKEEKKKGADAIGLIGRGMAMEGRLTFDDTVRIDGSFKGEIISAGTLVVGEGAQVHAEVKVDTAIITGEVRGMVEARSRIELKSPARIQGELRTPNLIIGEGAVFEGNCVMLKKDTAASAATVSYRTEDAADDSVHEPLDQ